MTRSLLLAMIVGTGLPVTPAAMDAFLPDPAQIEARAPADMPARALTWGLASRPGTATRSTVLLARPSHAAPVPGDARMIRLVAENLPGGGGERRYRLVIN